MTNKDVEIRIFASQKEYAERDSQDEPKVRKIITDNILPKSKAEYYRVDVKIKRKEDQTPQYIVAYMLRKDIYLAEVVKVDVDADFHEKRITFNYDDSRDSEEEEEDFFANKETQYECAYDFVAATPVPDIPSAKKAVEDLNNLAISVGLRSKILLGTEATVANYKQYLMCGLKGFVNVGHGNPNEIVLDDGILDSTWFNNVSNKALHPEVVYFNSCQVSNDPLKTSIMKAGARTFIGGVVNLLIGPSEEVCKCFWGKVLRSSVQMGDVLHQCEKEKYPDEGSHGISGDTGPFLTAYYSMGIHGHSMQIQDESRLKSIWRSGFTISITGINSVQKQDNWFHFAIPTPVVANGKQLKASKIWITCKTSNYVHIQAIHVWDGGYRIATHEPLKLESKDWGRYEFDIHSTPKINWGVGISINVQFGTLDAPGPLVIQFNSAGCEFIE